eukprot:Sdes_comp21613_c0_seq1m20208
MLDYDEDNVCTATQEVESMTQEFHDSQSGDADGQSSQKTAVWGRLLPLDPSFAALNLINQSYLLGRHPTCDHCINDPAISNRHFELYQVRSHSQNPLDADPPGGERAKENSMGMPTFLRDLSSNGTFLNGQKIGRGKSVIIKNNDEIALARRRKAYVFQDFSERENRNVHHEASGIFSKYSISKILGNGNFAEVKLGVELDTGRRFAVKIIDKKKLFLHPSLQESLSHEVEILKSVHHPCITAIHDVFDTPLKLYIVLELVSGGELFDKIVKEGHFTEEDTKYLFFQMLQAVKYLHDKGITHRDLKPENVLLSSTVLEKCVVKITDFGLAKIVGENSFMKTVCGTPNYLAPEVISIADRRKGSYGKSVDCWSLGVILYICLCGVPPFNDESEGDTLYDQITEGNYVFDENDWNGVSEEAKDLVRKLLTVDPNLRYSVHQALAHPWLQEKEIYLKCEKVLKNNGYSIASFTGTPTQCAPSPMGPPAAPISSRNALRPPQGMIKTTGDSPLDSVKANLAQNLRITDSIHEGFLASKENIQTNNKHPLGTNHHQQNSRPQKYAKIGASEMETEFS